jgi:hypothetical protein
MGVIAITYRSGDAHVQSEIAEGHYRVGFQRYMQHEAV